MMEIIVTNDELEGGITDTNKDYLYDSVFNWLFEVNNPNYSQEVNDVVKQYIRFLIMEKRINQTTATIKELLGE